MSFLAKFQRESDAKSRKRQKDEHQNDKQHQTGCTRTYAIITHSFRAFTVKNTLTVIHYPVNVQTQTSDAEQICVFFFFFSNVPLLPQQKTSQRCTAKRFSVEALQWQFVCSLNDANLLIHVTILMPLFASLRFSLSARFISPFSTLCALANATYARHRHSREFPTMNRHQKTYIH